MHAEHFAFVAAVLIPRNNTRLKRAHDFFIVKAQQVEWCTEETAYPKKPKRRKPKEESPPATKSRKNGPTLVWLRRDLRLFDNPALHAAATGSRPVIPFFIAGSTLIESYGGASRLWLHHSLDQLSKDLQQRFKSRLILRGLGDQSDVTADILGLVRDTGASAVYWNRLYEPPLVERDKTTEEALREEGITVKTFPGYLLHDPQSIQRKYMSLLPSSRGHFGSFAPFLRTWNTLGEPSEPLQSPSTLPAPKEWPASQKLADLQLARMPRSADGEVIDWGTSIASRWNISESAALKALEEFTSSTYDKYDSKRGRADGDFTSCLSPYLFHGQISVRTVYHKCLKGERERGQFIRRLIWRDLSYWQLHLFPQLATQPLRPSHKEHPWEPSHSSLFVAWRKGQTGFPLVDAGMRELTATGWMHQNVRMVCASFLVEALNVSWKEGMQCFNDRLVDADGAINSMMWQNAGRTGLDQWNFVLDPVATARTIDPTGDYVRKWVPELAHLSSQHIHSPWSDPDFSKSRLGDVYPKRMITSFDEATRRSRDLLLQTRLTLEAGEHIDEEGYDLVDFQGEKIRVFTRPELRKSKRTPAISSPHAVLP